MGNGISKVMPGLYIGNFRDSKDSGQLDKFQISHILSIHDGAKKLYPDKHYLCISASDNPEQNLSQYFSICNDFIHAARLRGGNVLIHCLAGMSRSATIAVAYVMSVTTLDSWSEALKVVRVGRNVANPNSGFQKQLREFENSRLQEERKRLKERFPSLALAVMDEEYCRRTLVTYRDLISTNKLCDGNCGRARRFTSQPCPTGSCDLYTKKLPQLRKSVSASAACLGDVTRPKSGSIVTASRCKITDYARSGSVQSLTQELQSMKFASAPASPENSPKKNTSTDKTKMQHSNSTFNVMNFTSLAPLVNLDEELNQE